MKGRGNREDLRVDGRITLEWSLGKQGGDWMHLTSEQEPGACSCEHGNERTGSIKGGEFFD